MNEERKKGIILSYTLIILNILVAIIYTPFMTRMLGQSEYGLYSLVSSIIGYLTILDFGFGNAIIVYTTKYKERNDTEGLKKLHGMFALIYWIISLIAIIIGLILFFNADLLFKNSMNDIELHKAKIMLLILTFNLGITFPFTIYSSIITANEKFTFQKGVAIVRTVLNPIIMIPLLLLGYKAIAMIIVVTILNIVTLLSNYFYCRKKLNIKIKFYGIDKKILKEICGYSIFIFINIVIDKVNWSIDQFILGSVSGTIAVSIYAIASQFNTLYLNFSTAISGVLLPKFTKMIENNINNNELSKEFIKTSRIQYYILYVIITGFIIFGKDVIVLLFGLPYKKSYYVALILMIPATVPLIQNVGISILQAKKLHKFRSIILFIIAICNIVISIPLAKIYDCIGAAIGTGISIILGNIIIINLYYNYRVKLNMKKFWLEILIMTLKMLLPTLLIIILIKFISLGKILKILLYIPLYLLIYSVYCYKYVMNNYEKNIVGWLLVKLHIKKVKNERSNK